DDLGAQGGRPHEAEQELGLFPEDLHHATSPSERQRRILLLRVRAVTPRRRAASVLLPPEDSMVERIAKRSISRSLWSASGLCALTDQIDTAWPVGRRSKGFWGSRAV